MQFDDTSIERHVGVAMYRRMRLIRRFEERVVDLVNSNEVAGITHEYVGQEAVAVGVCTALRSGDVITSTHRGHGHILAKGGQPDRMFAELMGRSTGYNRGRGGSMHIADLSLGIFGANGIVGAGTPMACGAAHAFRQKSTDSVAVAFFGDGAINQGVVHESMNLAAVMGLPVVFVCENNLYAVTMPISAVTKEELWRRATAYGMPATPVDGMNVIAVYQAACDAVDQARSGKGPTFLECRTYRYVGHQTAERVMNLNYRNEAEIEVWRARDPIESWAAALISSTEWTEEERAAVDAEIEVELDQAVEFARLSEWPAAETTLDYMYADPAPGYPAQGWES